MANEPLELEYKFYESKRAEFLKKYSGKVLLIRGEERIGVFDSEQQAYEEGVNRFGNEAFLVIRVVPQEKEVIATFPALYTGVIYATN